MHGPLAHSARNGTPAQTYASHVGNVARYASQFAAKAAAFSSRWGAPLLAAVSQAAPYHDLGKLDEIFQAALRTNAAKTGINHVDAGTAYLITLKLFEAALATYSHHRGLPSLPEEKAKAKFVLRDPATIESTQEKLWQRTDRLLADYLCQHDQIIPRVEPSKNVHFIGLVRRLALSSLVDADFSDTAQNYLNERELSGEPLRAAERLEQLDRYVAKLGAITTQNETEALRAQLRADTYDTCRHADIAESLVACDSPVGTGKTTAIMAHLLKTAHQRGLRRIFVILPFTNIIDQSVDVYRRALVLPGEDPERIVAAHHHRVEFDGADLRQLTHRWDCPIIVTTAVQFFETLAACKTSRLRKLHQLPGSGIFVDEAHAAIPAVLWPQSFRWLNELCRDWSCHLVLGSGSLVRFWQLPEFVPPAERPAVAELVPDILRERAAALETQRVELATIRPILPLDTLTAFVRSKPGPRLVIFNTIQSAAFFAHHLRDSGESVEHLSTALTPVDRAVIVQRVRARLKDKTDDNWYLVATSCVEAGVDFSFRTAFRESCGVVNVLQISGRANRSYEYASSQVWDFRIPDDDGFFSLHPHFGRQRVVLAQMFAEGKVSPDHCTEALLRELNAGNGNTENRIELIRTAEKAGDYPLVADECRVIDDLTTLVVVDPGLIARLRAGVIPSQRQIAMHSVQMYDNKLEALNPDHVGEVRALRPGQYDDFIGYMRGLLASGDVVT
jgi:CRISPR-associated endonuclease/helicase Cas3